MRGAPQERRLDGRVSCAARLALAVLALIAATIAPASASAATRAELTSAKLARGGGSVELHFGFRGAAPRWNLSAHGDELWIDLPRTASDVPPRPLFGQETAPLKTVRVIDRSGGRTRIVIEVDGRTDYAIARTGNEIVMRVASAGTVANLAAPLLLEGERNRHARSSAASRRTATRSGQQTASNATPPIPELKSASPALERHRPVADDTHAEISRDRHGQGHPMVMIDPGHGGYDPGTSAASGIDEKNIAMEIAARLQRALEANGIRAMMTRTTDVLVPLPERTRIANHADADLFVSIHLNSSPNTATTGIEVYYLNNTTDRATIRLARIENAGAPQGYSASDGANLNYILTDLRQQYKANEAASLARMIDAQAVADLDAGLGFDVNALGAKMGPFYVLVGAHMPAVLVECGFLSNPAEARRLDSANYQEILAQGIATAIVHYFNEDAAVGNL